MDTFFTNPFAIKWKEKLAQKRVANEAVVEDEQVNEPWTDRPEYGPDGLPSE